MKNKFATLIVLSLWCFSIASAQNSVITPSFGPYDKDGSEFVIEGRGVTPDIILENDPAKQYKGEDAQLNKAIAEMLKDIENWKEKITPIPPFPDKSGKK